MGFCPCGVLSPWAFVTLGFCLTWILSPWAFVPLGFCPPGFLSSWDFVRLDTVLWVFVHWDFVLEPPATVANSGVESQGGPRGSTIHGSPPPTGLPPPHEKLLNLQLGPGPGPRGTSPPLDATAQQPLPQARSHGGGARGGSAPLEKFEPPLGGLSLLP